MSAGAAAPAGGTGRRTDTRVAREKSERLLARAEHGVKDARREVEAAEFARDADLYGGKVESAAGWAAKLRPVLDRFVALDREVAELVDAVADAVLDGQVAFDEASALAERLGRAVEFQRLASRPTIVDARLLVNVAVALDRQARDRDDVNGWAQPVAAPGWSDPGKAAYDQAVATLSGACQRV